MSGSPLGEVAERNGSRAIAGTEYEVRLLFEPTRDHEWSLGVLGDRFLLDQGRGTASPSAFDYRSTGLVVGYTFTKPTALLPLVYRADLGWMRFRAASSASNFYTGEPESSRTRGDALVLGLSYGIEIPLRFISLIPRVRIATNYPDFGGGEGFSGLHRENDLGFKASFGVSVNALTPRAQPVSKP